MKIKLALLLFLPILSFAQIESYSIGEIHKIESKALNETRILNIHLPLNYSKDSIYPVIYVLDGSAHEDFLHIVGLVQFFELQFFMPKHIVVGIENVDRKRDFTFHTDKESLTTNFPTSGHSAEFLQFIETELQPYVNKHFKTNGTNYLIGQSLGGLLASEVLLKKPDLFTHYLIVSPSLWWDNTSMMKEASSRLKSNPKKPVYVSISVGGKEHRIMKRDAKNLKKAVKRAKNDQISLHFNLLRKENHATILHNALYAAFEELYPFVGDDHK